MIDPRPDLRGDSKLWNRKLETAFWIDGNEPRGMFAILHGARCLGATLEVFDDGYRIQPPEDTDPEEWTVIRRDWLKPHATTISNLLRRPNGKANSSDNRRAVAEPSAAIGTPAQIPLLSHA